MSRLMRWLLLGLSLLLLFVPPAPVQAQAGEEGLIPTTRFTHLTADQGLSHNTVSAIEQDARGFIWIGTLNGLSRYDGYRLISYQHDPTHPNSLTGNEISDLVVDRTGVLWIAGRPGVSRFDPVTERFTRYPNQPQAGPQGTGVSAVSSVFEDSQGRLWFGAISSGQIFRFNPDTEQFTGFAPPTDSPDIFQSGTIWEFQEDEAGSLWFVVDLALVRFEPESGRYTSYIAPADERFLKSLQRDAAGRWWIGGERGLYRFDPQTGQFTLVEGRLGRIESLLADKRGLLWVGSAERGLYRFDPDTGTLDAAYRHAPTDAHSLGSDEVTTLALDRGGVLWVGLAQEGLSRFKPGQMPFVAYRHEPSRAGGLPKGEVTALAGETSAALWVATGGLLNEVNLEAGRLISHTLPSPPRDISALERGAAETLWVASSFEEPLTRFTPATGTFETLPLPPPPVLPGEPQRADIVDLQADEDGSLWVAIVRDTLYRLDASGERIEVYEMIKAREAAGANRARLQSLAAAGAGAVWVGFGDGSVGRFHAASQQIDLYLLDGVRAGVRMIHVGEQGVLWLATELGLVRLDTGTGSVRRYLEADGLPSAFLSAIAQDGAGQLWISTARGISRFDPTTEEFQSYTVTDGLHGNDFLARVVWAAPDGRLLFGGPEGMTLFDPAQIAEDSYQPPVVLTELRLFNDAVLPRTGSLLERALWATESLTLTPAQDVVAFEFAALSYVTPEENRYRYRLEGYDRAWNEVDSSRRFARYTSLPAGSYLLRVQGSNHDGVWSEQEATLRVTVLPPWWETLWFRVAALAALAALLYAAYRLRVYAMQQRTRQLEQQVAQRTQELSDSEARFRGLATSTFEAVLVHDAGQILDANQAALTLFGYSDQELLGQPLTMLLASDSQPLLAQGEHSGAGPVEIQGITRAGQRIPLEVRERAVPFQGRPARVLALRDLTERQRLETQQRQLAVMEERERIGRELHDDLGQVMGYVTVQAETARLLLEQGEVGQVQATLGQLQEVAREAHEDVRQYILGVRTTPPAKPQNFRAALSDYLAQIRERYGLTVHGSWPDDLPNDLLAPEVETQLLRIIQEALTNVRKHAGVERARLLLTVHPDSVQVILSDEGRGFERVSEAEQEDEGGSFGLRIMRERAEAVGGTLQVRSTPGAGTEVIATLPRTFAQPVEAVLRGLRVLLVDDHPLYLEGLRNMLSVRGLQVVGVARDGLEAQEMARTLRPTLILMDVEMPRCNGLEATQRIKLEFPDTQIVMLTVAADDEKLFEALRAGASGYLLKALEGPQFFMLLQEVMRGEIVLAPTLAARALQSLLNTPPPAAEPPTEAAPALTQRQQEVLELLAQGRSNKEIARALTVTEATVKFHVGQILERLQVQNRYELARYAQQQGLVSAPREGNQQD